MIQTEQYHQKPAMRTLRIFRFIFLGLIFIGVTNLSSETLVTTDKEVNDRFTLYPTQNMYTFILLDQLDGKTWQVQWSTEASNRGIMPIE